jgi:hypothetical protein
MRQEGGGWSCKIAKGEDKSNKEEEDANGAPQSKFDKMITSSRSVQFPVEWFGYMEAFSMIALPSFQGKDKTNGPNTALRKMLSEIDCEDIFRTIFSQIPGVIEWVVTTEFELPVCTLNLGLMDTFDYEKDLSEGIEAARIWDLIGNDEHYNYAFLGGRCLEIDEFKWKEGSWETFNKMYLQCESCGWLVKTSELIKCRAEIANKEMNDKQWLSCCRFSCIECTKKVHGSYVSEMCTALCDMCLETTEVCNLVKLCDDNRWCEDCLRDGESLNKHQQQKDKKRVERCDACRRRRLFFSKRKKA